MFTIRSSHTIGNHQLVDFPSLVESSLQFPVLMDIPVDTDRWVCYTAICVKQVGLHNGFYDVL